MNIEDDIIQDEYFKKYGIYQIRAVSVTGQPIPICRIGGIDNEGIIYIGRSGLKVKNPKRTLSKRINEFKKQKHSGGRTYSRAAPILEKCQNFYKHRLQARARFLKDSEIKKKEVESLNGYFQMYAELPPCNTQMPSD